MDVTETTVETSTLDFHVLRAGEGDRDALLFHGFPDDAYSMVPLMERLADRGFTCTAPYMRGYAPTETPSPSPDNY
ncbi:MAG: alpha/beta fold hydrolase, partial [Halobacteriota archaeon]